MITIKSNDRGRQFLVFDTLFDLDKNPNFQDNTFSAVYITNDSLSETITILTHINPITSRKCCYKPFFVSKKHEGKLGEYSELVDGYIYDINDAETDNLTESILANLNETGIQRIVDDLSSSNLLFIRLLRFHISRKRRQLVPVLMEGSNLGYVLPVMSIFYKMGLYRHREYIIFMQTMFEKGYLRATQFLNKVYLCPQCMHTHLLYIETCPKCGSSNIKSEEVIHHFRCANIAPESAYNYGGQLRCPKCHQQLRHIGVDYDRPSTVFFCKSCTNSFLQPNMKVICTNCKKESTVSALVPNDVVAYEITEKGRRELISTNVYGSIYTEFYDNYIEYEHFINRLKLLAQQVRYDNDRLDVSVIQIWLLDSHTATRPIKSEFISYVCEAFRYNNISFANYMLYIKYAEHNDGIGNTEEFNRRLTEVMNRLSSYIQPDEVLCYARTSLTDESIDDFANRLDLVPEIPEGYFGYKEPAPDAEPLFQHKPTTYGHETVSVDNEPVPTEDNDVVSENEQPESQSDKRNRRYWLLALFLAVVLVGVGLVFLAQSHRTVKTESQEDEITLTTDTLSVGGQALSSEKETAEANASDSVSARPVVTDTPVSMDNLCVEGRYYVVAGAFKSYENAVKQMEMMQKKNTDCTLAVYFNGRKYIISPFVSEDRDACSQFIVNHRTQFPGAWIL